MTSMTAPCPFDHTAQCDTCHHVARVHLNRVWVGGRGYQSEYRCCDEAACAGRRRVAVQYVA
jgi:hypothetical protein